MRTMFTSWSNQGEGNTPTTHLAHITSHSLLCVPRHHGATARAYQPHRVHNTQPSTKLSLPICTDCWAPTSPSHCICGPLTSFCSPAPPPHVSRSDPSSSPVSFTECSSDMKAGSSNRDTHSDPEAHSAEESQGLDRDCHTTTRHTHTHTHDDGIHATTQHHTQVTTIDRESKTLPDGPYAVVQSAHSSH